MKKLFWIASLLLITGGWSFAQTQDPYNDNSSDDVYYTDNTPNANEQPGNDGMSYQTFYDQLSPYGSWIDYPGYGYVWVPQANAGFSPYMSEGHWAYTDYGWTWVSDYQWGWATFHYGRWFEDPAYGGWLWIPGYDWAPAWVTWGQYEGYYCWAPVGPRDYINGHWGYGHYEHHWNCLPNGRMGEVNMSRYVVNNNVVNHDRADFERRVTVIHNVNTYNRSVFNSGPRVKDVERVSGHYINKIAVATVSKPAPGGQRGNQVEIYRPTISRSNPAQRAIPANLVRPENIRTTTPRTESQRSQPAPGQYNAPRSQPSNNNTWTPPRQNHQRNDQQYFGPSNPTPQPRQQSQPMQQPSRPSGGFIPSERPAQQQMPRSEPMRPAPSFHAPAPQGGGMRGGGGGRHR